MRAILDALLSHRVDFSGHWTHAREDFERIMGYRNHRPISMRLKNIRDAAACFFEASERPRERY